MIRSFAALAVSAFSMLAAAAAEPPLIESPAAASSNVVYDAEFFSKYDLATAEEMLRRIPGVASILDATTRFTSTPTKRGFGSTGDQILLDGRRIAGKSNEIVSALRRIQRSSVERVELVRGTSRDIAVLSEGIVVNIVLKEGASIRSASSVLVATQFNEEGALDVDGAASYNGGKGGLSYLASIEKLSVSRYAPEEYTDSFRDERYRYPNGTLRELRPQEFDRDQDQYTLTTNLTYAFRSGAQLRVNGLAQLLDVIVKDRTDFTRFAPDGTPTLYATDSHRRLTDGKVSWEIGGEFERPLADTGLLSVLTVYNHKTTPTRDGRDLILGSAVNQVSRNTTDVSDEEAIVRGSYSWQVNRGQSLELGAEGARNTLQQVIALAVDLNQDGVVEDVDIFDPDSQVQELRGELFAKHNWSIDADWTLETSLNLELSEISQEGLDVNRSRNFSFLKPRLDLRRRFGRDQLRLKIERTVSQLNFQDFVPRFDFLDRRVDAGNPGLRPETAWEYELRYEHRLANDRGSLEGRVFYLDIQDAIERVAIDPEGDGTFVSASGNIGDGERYGAEAKMSLRMGWIGLPDLLVNGRYLRRHSTVTDPFTGSKRRSGGDQGRRQEIEAEIRHDVIPWRLSYGMNYRNVSPGMITSDLRERRLFYVDPKYNAFLEKKLFANTTVRFEIWGMFRNVERRYRTLYLGDVTSGIVTGTESYVETRDRRYTASIRAEF
jgi:outer membrane receptor for ferrienterochelin and colicins